MIGCFMAFGARAQKPAMIMTAASPTDESLGRYVGHDAQFYYALRIKFKDGGNHGYIDARSRQTLEVERTIPVEAPVVNAESFKVEEIIFGRSELGMFYSFYDGKRRNWTWPSPASIRSPARSVRRGSFITNPGDREVIANNYLIKYHDRSGLTTVLILSPIPGRTEGYDFNMSPDFHVLVLDPGLRVVSEGGGELSPLKWNAISDVFLSEQGDVYMRIMSTRNVGNTLYSIVSFDHRTAEVHAVNEPDKDLGVKDGYDMGWSRPYDATRAKFFTASPDGRVYLVGFVRLEQFKGRANVAGVHVIAFDPATCAYEGERLFRMHTRDVHNDMDPKAEFPPALYNMELASFWWTDDGRLQLALQRKRLVRTTTYMDDAAIISWDPDNGLGEAYIHAQSQVLSMTQTDVGGTIFVPGGKDALLIFEDAQENAGHQGEEGLRAWSPHDADRNGLVPMSVRYEDGRFGPREPILDRPVVPPYDTFIWAYLPQEHEAVVELKNRKEWRLVRLSP